MAAKLERSPAVTPSSACSSSSEFSWPASWGNPGHGLYSRSVSDQPATPRRAPDNQSYFNFHTALRCKQNVGTKEWINCKQRPCVELRDELHHLLECRYRHIGGCNQRCIHLREELAKFREHQPKYATLAEAQLQTRQFPESEGLQVQLQALKIEECVAFSTYSPTSPDVQEPFQLMVEGRRKTEEPEDLVAVTELIPLDQTKLSVSGEGYRKGHEWSKICFLGSGAFGSTYLCYDNHRNYHFAIKKLPVKSFEEDEINVWQKLSDKHPNILDLYGALERKERVLIFMEYMNGGSVADYLAKNGPFNERNSLSILQQVLSGLDFMHRCRIIHGDVKAANILMDHLCMHIKIADFGSCVDLNAIETGGRFRLAGTLAFMAPEVCRSETPSPSSDIWSAMCLLIQMLSDKAPWEEYRHQGDGLLFVIGSAKRPPILPECSEVVQEIFAKGLNVNASLRPTAAEFLRHRAFNFMDGDGEISLNESSLGYEDDSESDDSTEYHSSRSSDFDTSEEYFSTDDFDDKFSRPDSISPVKANTPNARSSKTKHVDNKGGHVKITNARITIPTDALQTDTKVSITSLDAAQFYQPIVDNDIEDQVTILGNVYKLRPSGLKFQENVSVTVTLPEALHQSEDIMVFHGSLDKKTNKFLWEEIKETLLPFQDSTKVTVNITHFSALLFAKCLPSFAYEYMITYLNYKSSWFRIIVFISRDESKQEGLEIRLVLVRDSFYLNTSHDLFENRFIGHKLREEGFVEIYGSRREYFIAKEKIEVCIEGLEGGSVVSPKSHVVGDVFGGEEIAKWEVNEHAPTGGTVVMKRSAGQTYRFQFWEHEPTRYVQDELGLCTLRHTNMLPLARALSLSQGEVNDLVETTEGDEEEQLRQITELWKTKAENNELPQLCEFVASVPHQELLVSDRGKSHLGHLFEFSQKLEKRRNSDKPPMGEDLYFETMAVNAENLCQSVCSDCLLQNDHSEKTIRFVSTRCNFDLDPTMMRKFLEIVRQGYSETVSEKLSALVVAFENYEKYKNSCSTCQCFCEKLLLCIPWLMQIVKDLFKVHPITEPTGLWGLPSCENEPSNIEAGQEKKSNKIFGKILDLLRDLCKKNLPNDDRLKLEQWHRKLLLENFLEKLPITHKGWLSLAARIKYYHQFAREIMDGDLSRIHRQDLENLLDCLRQYVVFCPKRLVQFCCSGQLNVEEEQLRYEPASNTFTQKFVVSMSGDVLNLTVEIKVCIQGVLLSEKVNVTLQRCEQQDDTPGQCCTTLNVVYEHSGSEGGRFKIFNECEALCKEQLVTVRAQFEETDGSPTIPMKKGCPELTELCEIARKVTSAWKLLGLKLLSDYEVSIIDEDERKVVEKATAMFVKWKQVKGNDATYGLLYEALVFVQRNDIAEEFCLVRTQAL